MNDPDELLFPGLVVDVDALPGQNGVAIRSGARTGLGAGVGAGGVGAGLVLLLVLVLGLLLRGVP